MATLITIRGVGELSIVVVAHNNERELERCLEGVAGWGHEVVVVDNASEDGSVELVRERFPDVTVIEAGRNLGYGAANNIGFAHTSGDLVLVLNPDAWPLGKGVERLVEAARAAPWAAIVGPRLVTESGRREQSVRGFPTVWRLATEFLFLRWLAPRSKLLNAFYGAGVPDAHGPVEWVMGAVMLVRRDAFEEIGGFDPSFFMYAEEVDLAYRLRGRGWGVLYAPHAEFVHLGGSSTPSPATSLLCELLRSHVRFLAKHHGPGAARRGRAMLMTAMRLRARIFGGARGEAAAHAARWLAEQDVASLLGATGRAPAVPKRHARA